jgi:uncharacterized repeat protein (TIGR01451 family)
MRKHLLFCLLFFMVPFAGWAQLTGITPVAGVPGQPLQTTITSNGLFIQSWSPSGNINKIRLTPQGGGTDLMMFDVVDWLAWPSLWLDIIITHPDTVKFSYTIPLNAATGVYDLKVTTGLPPDNPLTNLVTYTLPGAFTVNPPDGYISGAIYRDENRNGMRDAGEAGIAGRRVFLQEFGYYILTDANGEYSFGVSNGSYTVFYQFNTLDYTDYMYATTPETLSVSINNNNSVNNDFGFKNALYDLDPDTVYIATPDTIIFYADEPIVSTGAQSYGNINLIRVNSSTPFNVPLPGVQVINTSTVKVPVTIPFGNQPGDSISVYIRTLPFQGSSRTHYLYNKLVIGQPTGYITGNVYYDQNLNGIKDPGEINLPVRPMKFLPNNISINTDTSGNYSFPANAGNYDVVRIKDPSNYMYNTSGQDTVTTTVTTGNPPPIDFGLYFALQSIQPDTAYRGITQLHTVTSSKPIFFPGANPFGNIVEARVLTNPPINIILSTSVNVIDSFTITVNIPVPINVPNSANVDFRVRVNDGSTWNYHYLSFSLNIETPPSLISGKAFFDQNQNKQFDSGEPGLNTVRLESLPDSSISFSDQNGDYFFGSLGGPFTVNYISNNFGLALFSDSASYTFQAFGAVTGKDFGFITTNPDYSIQTQVPHILPRCNRVQMFTFPVRNISNIPYLTRAWLKMDPQVNFVSTPIQPYNISNDTIFWDIGTMQPFTDTVISANFLLPGAGNVIGFVAGAHSLDSNNVIQNTSSYEKIWQVLCAWDPNDKQVSPPGVLNEHFTLMSDTLEYLIRFQNTGNDTAFTVIVRDTLDANLDLSTFEILGSSHSMQTEIKSNGAAAFIFNNILLPDSNVNEPASHGYILYRIRVKPGLPDATPINNTAHIFFDLNPAVVTNTTLNTMVYVLNTGVDEIDQAMEAILYPNPINTTATLYFSNPDNSSHRLILTDLAGRLVQPMQVTSGNQFNIDRKNLAGGVYFYEVTGLEGRRAFGKVVIR